MKLVIQRVNSASVSVISGVSDWDEVPERVVSKINKGLLVLVGIHKEDTQDDIDFIIKKLLNLRLFDFDNKFCEKSVKDLSLEILCVSQFTLYASCKKGNRPSFDKAMSPKEAKVFYSNFLNKLKQQHSKVKDGEFGAYMQVSLVNDGPVTIVLDRKKNSDIFKYSTK